jgi:TPR repeat protein
LIGDGHAMFKIGIKYFNGSSFKKNKDTSLKWIQNAAKSGLLKTQLLVGKLNENGSRNLELNGTLKRYIILV